MTKPVTTGGLQDSPHLYWYPWCTRTANRPYNYKGERKSVLQLAFHRLQSRCFQTPWNKSVVCINRFQNRPSQCTPDTSSLSLSVFHASLQLKKIRDTNVSVIFNYLRAVLPVIFNTFLKEPLFPLKGWFILLPDLASTGKIKWIYHQFQNTV